MKYILYYSNQCKHSKDIINIITQYNISNNFSLLDISTIDIPNYIKSVPSLIIPKGDGEADLLVGSNLFKWINTNFLNKQSNSNETVNHNSNEKKQINHDELNKKAQQQLSNDTKKDISDFEPSTMKGFSDNFSFISDNGPIDHNFSFLDSNIGPVNNELPYESRQPSNEINNQEKKNEMDKAYSQMMEARSNDSNIPQPITRQ